MPPTDPATPTGNAISGINADSGTVTSADDGELTDSDQHWPPNEHAGRRVESKTANGVKTVARIDGNDETTLTLGPWSNGVPVKGERYTIYGTAIPFLILAADLVAAGTLWRKDAPRQFKGLLDDADGWTWDSQAQAYASGDGHRVGGSDLKALSSTFAEQVQSDMRAQAVKVAAGAAPVEIWQREMAAAIKDSYICQAVLAAGGFDRYTPGLQAATVGEAGEPPGIAFSIARLQGFAEDWADGRYANVGAILSRAAAYANASRAVFETVRRDSHINTRGPTGKPLYLFEKNVLNDTADHCADDDEKMTDGCPELTELGWQPIGLMPVPGLRTCAQSCRCHLTFSLIGDALGAN